MYFQGIIELGTAPKVVALAPGVAGAEVSKNGGPFVVATNPVPVAIGSNYFSVQLTVAETSQLGPLVVRFVGSAPEVYVVLQVRRLMGEAREAVAGVVQAQVSKPLLEAVGKVDTRVKGQMAQILPSLAAIKRDSSI